MYIIINIIYVISFSINVNVAVHLLYNIAFIP